MRLFILPTGFSLSALMLFLCPFAAQAQSFRATQSNTGLHDPAKIPAYMLDIESIHAYVQESQGPFLMSLAFSDTLQWEFNMEPFDVRSATYRLHSSHGMHDSSPVVTYKGSVNGVPGSQVRMTVADGYFRALVEESTGVSYYIDMTDSPSEVTLKQGDPDEDPAYCASGSEHHVHGLTGGGKAGSTVSSLYTSLAPYEAEIAFVVDRTGFGKYNSFEELELELLTVLNYTDAYYTVHQLTYRLTEIYVIEDLESQPWDESSDAGQMLDNFTSWASGSTPLLHHDVATLWSGIDFGQTVGVAWIGAIGSPYRQNVVNISKGSERRNANIHTHELGHNWGSGHVGSGGWIMSAVLTSGNSEIPWHSSTLEAFPGYVENAMEHLDDVGSGDGGGDGGGGTALSINYSQLTITDDENGSTLLDPGETGNVNLAIENLDASPISDLAITMIPDNNRAINHATINSDPVIVGTLEGNETVTVTFNVSLSLEAPEDRSYRFVFELTDGVRTSETTLSFMSGDQLLPVELTSFSALESDGGVVLEWETATELNNAGFEIELQEEGGAFRRLAFIEGAGTSLDARRYTYRVESLRPGAYGFRLKQIDFDGAFEYSEILTLSLLPDAYALNQNYPNPFNPETRIEFHLPAAASATLEVFDVLGRRVAVLIDEPLQAGLHAAVFNASNLPNGTYVYRLVAGAYEETRTMILMK